MEELAALFVVVVGRSKEAELELMLPSEEVRRRKRGRWTIRCSRQSRSEELVHGHSFYLGLHLCFRSDACLHRSTRRTRRAGRRRRRDEAREKVPARRPDLAGPANSTTHPHCYHQHHRHSKAQSEVSFTLKTGTPFQVLLYCSIRELASHDRPARDPALCASGRRRSRLHCIQHHRLPLGPHLHQGTDVGVQGPGQVAPSSHLGGGEEKGN